MSLSRTFASEPPGGRNKVRGKTRPPLRTFAEMAEEFGVAPLVLRSALIEKGAPQFELRNKSTNKSETWYNPVEMRRWWKARAERLAQKAAT